jgi:hypothetical protein
VLTYAQGVLEEASRIGFACFPQPEVQGYISNEDLARASESITAHMHASHPELIDSVVDAICSWYIAGFGPASGSDREDPVSWALRMAATFADWTRGRKYDPDPWH